MIKSSVPWNIEKRKKAVLNSVYFSIIKIKAYNNSDLSLIIPLFNYISKYIEVIFFFVYNWRQQLH